MNRKSTPEFLASRRYLVLQVNMSSDRAGRGRVQDTQSGDAFAVFLVQFKKKDPFKRKGGVHDMEREADDVPNCLSFANGPNSSWAPCAVLQDAATKDILNWEFTKPLDDGVELRWWQDRLGGRVAVDGCLERVFRPDEGHVFEETCIEPAG